MILGVLEHLPDGTAQSLDGLLTLDLKSLDDADGTGGNSIFPCYCAERVEVRGWTNALGRRAVSNESRKKPRAPRVWGFQVLTDGD
jgi:hypothetical protein